MITPAIVFLIWIGIGTIIYGVADVLGYEVTGPDFFGPIILWPLFVAALILTGAVFSVISAVFLPIKLLLETTKLITRGVLALFKEEN